MTSWQRRLRGGLAIFGIVFAGLVYRSIGERQAVAPPRPVDRLDPKALSETVNAVLEQERGTEREFVVKSERALSYSDGSVKQFNVEITVRGTEGKVFVVTAKEAQAGPNQVELQLSGGVKVAVSDGFELLTDQATYNQTESTARAPGDVTFKKGQISGAGRNATYNQKSDVLNIAEQAKVVMTDQAGKVTLDGHAGTATLDRLQDVLFMDSNVHVLRGTQIIDAEKLMARLSVNEDVVTAMELRGNASVQGGSGPLQSMKANAIDLDYTDDGTIIERALLNGAASLQTAADEHVASRQMSGEGLDVQMAADGSVAKVTGRDGVQLNLPEADGTPPRNIRARTLEGDGEPGKGLTSLRFRDDVIFEEDVKRGGLSREVRAQALNVALDGNGLTTASFGGGVSFKDSGLQAGALNARYEPAKNALSLLSEKGPRPFVTDDKIHVEAREIEVALDSHGMAARGNVRTTLSGRPATSKGRDGESGRLPALLKEGEAASVNAERLDYSGGNGRAEYEGTASLLQGNTAIRADLIVLDQQKGDLVATGSARSALMLDTGQTDGRANEIRYDEAKRTVTYSSAGVAPTTGQRSASPLAQVVGANGDLRAERIEVVLAGEENAVERLEAYTRVTMVLGQRTATGGRLTYHAKEERYLMSGSGATGVTLRESCRETTGRTLTFFKSTDRIIVDGDETRRTETKPCTPPPSTTPRPSPAPR